MTDEKPRKRKLKAEPKPVVVEGFYESAEALASTLDEQLGPAAVTYVVQVEECARCRELEEKLAKLQKAFDRLTR